MGFTLETPEEINDEAEMTGELASIEESPPDTESEAAEVEASDDPKREQAKKDYMEALKQAEDALVSANLLEAEMQGRVKAAKLLRAECLEDLKRIHAKGIDGYMDSPETSKEEASQESVPEAEATEDYENWQAIPTASVMKGISGLGGKKLEALVDQYPTLGSLEDARGEASKSHEPFASMLPRGIGRNIADAIENAMMNAINLRPEDDSQDEIEYENALEYETAEDEADEPEEAEAQEPVAEEDGKESNVEDDLEWVDL